MNEYVVMGSNNYAVYVARRIPVGGTDTPAMVAQAIYETKEEWHGGRYLVIYDITDQLVVCSIVGEPEDVDNCEKLTDILKRVLTHDGVPLYTITTTDDGTSSIKVITSQCKQTDGKMKHDALKAGNPWECEFIVRIVR